MNSAPLSALQWHRQAKQRVMSRAFQRALFFAALYALLGAVYIWASDSLAARTSESVSEFQQIELLKGLLFIAVTSLVFFACAWVAMRKMEGDERKLLNQHYALLKSETRSMAGVFASSTAHDMNNILMTIYAELDELRETVGDHPESRQAMKNISLAVDEMSALSKRLMDCGQNGFSGGFTEVNLSSVVREVTTLTRAHYKVKRCEVEMSLPEALHVTSHPVAIQHMLINLVLNAADATDNEGKIRVLAYRHNGDVHLEVHDSGRGIPEEKREHIFEPFFTTKDDGTGLGLHSVKGCVDIHKGNISISDSDLGGACFRVTLPVKSE